MSDPTFGGCWHLQVVSCLLELVLVLLVCLAGAGFGLAWSWFWSWHVLEVEVLWALKSPADEVYFQYSEAFISSRLSVYICKDCDSILYICKDCDSPYVYTSLA
jgi:hypothetical protein